MTKIVRYLTQYEPYELASRITIAEVLEMVLTVMDRMPRPVRWIAGPLTSGRRTPEENRKRLLRTIYLNKEKAATFNYLPFQRRAMQILRKEYGKKPLSEDQKIDLQIKLRDQFYEPIFKSGRIGELRIMPGSDASLNVHWMMQFAKANGILARFIPEELVPK